MFYKFKCKNCGSKNTNKVILQKTKYVTNFCTGKKMLSNEPTQIGVYCCTDCCCISHIEYYGLTNCWVSARKNLKNYIDTLAKLTNSKVEVFEIGR